MSPKPRTRVMANCDHGYVPEDCPKCHPNPSPLVAFAGDDPCSLEETRSRVRRSVNYGGYRRPPVHQ